MPYHFNPRPREGGDAADSTAGRGAGISIHAPHEGGDEIRGARFEDISISIHAPHEGGD